MWFFSRMCFGQEAWNEWRIESQDSTSTLSNHTITLIKKTSPREVWIASTGSIFLFDGVRTERKSIRWKSSRELPVKRLIDVAKSSNGSTYLFTIQDGIYKLSLDRNQFEPILDNHIATKIGKIDAITFSPHIDATLILSGNRVFTMMLGTTAVSEIVLDTQANSPPIKGLITSRDGEVYVLYDEYITRLVWQLDRFVPQMKLQCGLHIPPISSSTETTDGLFYTSDSFGKLHLIKIDGKECGRAQISKRIRDATSDSRINTVQFLTETKALAISTDKGLLLISDQSLDRISTQNSPLRSDEIISVGEVSKDNIIIGSFVGVMHGSKSPFIAITRLPLERKPTVTAIASFKGTGTFVASKKGLYREIQHDDGISFKAFDLNQTHSSISALEVTEREVWVGLQDGRLLRCEIEGRPDSCNAAKTIQLSKAPITSISRATNSSQGVLITTLGGKAFKVENSEIDLITTLLFDLSDQNVRLLAVETTREAAWFFDFEGVWKTSLQAIEELTPESHGALQPAKLTDGPWAMGSAKQAVFFATPSGRVMTYEDVGRLVNGTPSTWSKAIDETIFAIEVDFYGRPWVGTNSGLWLKNADDNFRLEIETQGMNAIAADYGASHTDYNGNVYFGGTGGLISIRKPATFPQRPSGTVALTNIRLDETQLTIEDNFAGKRAQIQISDQKTKLGLEFGLSKLLWFQSSSFQHKLEGFDTDWQNTGNINVATYQNLPPGNYTFRARGADSTGVWSDNEISLPIQVLPPIWRSWWALLGYLILAVAALFYLKRVNDRYVAHQERLKLAEEGSAAFARLEDDYQAQREANEALLLRRAPSANALLDVVETALTAQLANADTRHAASAFVNKLGTLRSLQTLTDRTTSAERTDLHAVTEEIAARLAATDEVAARAIISNDVSKQPVPLEHAVYLCLVIQEALELTISGRHFHSQIDPIVFVKMPIATQTENDECSYTLRIEDSGLKHDDTKAVEELLPLTFHLIESGGGELSQDYDAGNILTITLLFPASSTLQV
ncbi:Two component regulator three Y motif family protein [gamma proteobacterium NOR5-3]|nr:Two component regulator three Y motif family protein [gamma proteobacterium NOR5-3]